ncbi:MAG: tetratricopeptide repeat protein [bacterium]|nr:tetratricopeptide repeat protein [bacterium]
MNDATVRAWMRKIIAFAAAVLILIIANVHAYPQPSQYPADDEALNEKAADLEKQLQNVTGSEKADVLNKLCELFHQDPPQAAKYAGRALGLARKTGYKQGEARALYLLAETYSKLDNQRKARELTRAALEIYQKSGDNRGIWNSLFALSNYYRMNDNYDDALKYGFQSLNVSAKLDDKGTTADSLFAIGSIYIRLNDSEKALEYLESALKTGKNLGQKKFIIYPLNSIGIVYMNMEKYAPALEYFQDALELFIEQGNNYGIGHTMTNIGIIYQALENYDESFEYFQGALKKYQEKGYKSGECRVLTQIGINYFKMKRYQKATSFYGDALKIAREVNDIYMIEFIYEKYADVYAASGDYKEAFKYHVLFMEVKDKRMDEKKNKQIALLQEQFESVKKAKEIEILKKTNKIKGITRNLFIAGFILVLILLVFIFKRYLYFFSFWKKQKYIAQYRLLESIGSGGMGNVYKAHTLRDKSSIVAIKVLKEELFKIESNRKRFKQEGAIIDKLVHPNILKIYERGVYENKLYFVMEYIEGKTLEKKIEEDGQLDLSECFHIMIQVAGALTLIHGRDVLHRDLKPANIMLTEKNGDPNFVKLLDFGLSKMKYQSRITESGILVGTINYLPPEQIIRFEHSAASDIYSLGIIFYEMVAGNIAFTGDSKSSIVGKILEYQPPDPNKIRPGIPADLNRLILQMISKQTTQRPSIQTVLNTLKEINPRGS